MEPFLVNQTRWSDLIKQLAVAKGLDHVEVLASLTAAIILENDRPEHKYLANEALAWGQYLFAAAGAGIVPYIGLRNPTASGKILILEAALALRSGTVGAEASGRLYYGIGRGQTLTQQNTEQPRDTRLQPTGAFGTAAPGIAGQIVSGRSDTIVVVPFVTGELVAADNGTATQTSFFQIPQNMPVVLSPGDTYFQWPSDGAGSTVANTQFQSSFFWRERTQEPTET